MQAGERMLISGYEFGRMTVGGKVYTGDLIICGGRAIGGWWRAEGHRLRMEDFSHISFENVTDLIIGTGHSGMMLVGESVRNYCRTHGIFLQAFPTARAVELFNSFSGDRARLVGAFHLTC